jgi:deoxyguanosine kinase
MEIKMHSRLYPLLSSGLPLPDLVVYLYADTDMLMERIANRDRPFERSMSRQYIDRLRGAYEEYFQTFGDAPLLRIDTTAMDFVGNAEHLRAVGERIRSRLGLGTVQESLL